MTRRAPFVLLALLPLALASFTPQASASHSLAINCDFVIFTDPVDTLWQQTCGTANQTLDCLPHGACGQPCIPRRCVEPCPAPDVGVIVGTLAACVSGTPPNSAGTTCPPAFGSGKGIYLDYGAPGASPEDKYLCVSATVGGAPCSASQVRVSVDSNIVPGVTECVSTTPPMPCSTPGPGWGVGIAPSCLVHLPWVQTSPPAPTTCPPGTLAPLRIWWGNTPGFPPGSWTDVCAV